MFQYIKHTKIFCGAKYVILLITNIEVFSIFGTVIFIGKNYCTFDLKTFPTSHLKFTPVLTEPEVLFSVCKILMVLPGRPAIYLNMRTFDIIRKVLISAVIHFLMPTQVNILFLKKLADNSLSHRLYMKTGIQFPKATQVP